MCISSVLRQGIWLGINCRGRRLSVLLQFWKLVFYKASKCWYTIHGCLIIYYSCPSEDFLPFPNRKVFIFLFFLESYMTLYHRQRYKESDQVKPESRSTNKHLMHLCRFRSKQRAESTYCTAPLAELSSRMGCTGDRSGAANSFFFS